MTEQRQATVRWWYRMCCNGSSPRPPHKKKLVVHAAAGALGRRGPTSPVGTAQSNCHFPTCRFVKGLLGSRLGLLQRADAHLSCTQRCSEREPPSGRWRPITDWDYSAGSDDHPSATDAWTAPPAQAVTEHRAYGPPTSGRDSQAVTKPRHCADALAMMALVCFGWSHRRQCSTTAPVMPRRTGSTRADRAERLALAKLADIGTLLRQARIVNAADQRAVAMKFAFHRRSDLSLSWLSCPSVATTFIHIDAVLQLTEAAMLGARALAPSRHAGALHRSIKARPDTAAPGASRFYPVR